MIEAMVSEMPSPGGWKHAMVRILAATETEARAEAQQEKEKILAKAVEVRWRVPFEYKERRLLDGSYDWFGFARFSFREKE